MITFWTIVFITSLFTSIGLGSVAIANWIEDHR